MRRAPRWRIRRHLACASILVLILVSFCVWASWSPAPAALEPGTLVRNRAHDLERATTDLARVLTLLASGRPKEVAK